ncbi:hypothetical protein XENOCAPTIV_012998, partial [Xenoophorus captivus]
GSYRRIRGLQQEQEMAQFGRVQEVLKLLLMVWPVLVLAGVRHPLPVLWMMPVNSGTGMENLTVGLVPAIRMALQDLERQAAPLGNYEVRLQLLDSQVSFVAPTPDLSNRKWHRHLFSTVPSVRAANMAVVKLLQRYRWRRIGVWFNDKCSKLIRFMNPAGPGPAKDQTLVHLQHRQVSLILYTLISSVATGTIFITLIILCIVIISHRRW